MKTKISAVIISASVIAQAGFVSAEASSFNLPDDINLIATSQYAGQNAASNGTQLNISWVNPDCDIDSITVTEEALGDITDEASISTDAGEYNLIQLKGLSKDITYVFTVSITEDSGEVKEYMVTGKPKTHMMNRCTEEGYKTIWNYKFEGIPSASGFYMDFNDKAGGYSSLKIVQNSDDKEFHFKTENDNHDPVDVGAEYEFSFWMKSDCNPSQKVSISNDWSGQYYLDLDTEWTKYSYKIHDIVSEGGKYSYKLTNSETGAVIEFKNQNNNRFCPRLRFMGGGVTWIDEMELHKYDSDGKLGANMYIDGDFEWGGALGASVTAQDSNATLKWTNPNSKYITEMSIINELGRIEASAPTLGLGAGNTVVIPDTEKGTVYDYNLRMIVNGVTHYIPLGFVGGNVTDKTGIKIYPLRILKDGKAVTELESGTLNISRKIDNEEGSKDFGGLLVAALYHDDELIAMTEASNVIKSKKSGEFATEITVPEITDGTFELRVFLWDSIDEQNILKNMKKVK